MLREKISRRCWQNYVGNTAATAISNLVQSVNIAVA